MMRLTPLRFLASLAAFGVWLTFIFREFIFNANTLLTTSDQLNNVGIRYLRSSFWAPQWDPSKLGGVPTLDAMFGDVYHPLSILHLIMDPARATGFKFIACIFIAFATAHILASRLTNHWIWGAILAAFYALNPQFLTHIYGGHDGKMMAISVLPLAIYAIHVYMKDHKFWALGVLTGSITYMLVGSHLQLTYFALWGLGFYSLQLNFMQNEDSWAKKGIRQGFLALAVGIALSISAIQIIPPMEYVKEHSVRSSAEKSSFGHAVSWSIHPEEMAAIFLPGFIQGISDPAKPEEVYWGHNVFKLSSDSPGILLIFFALAGLSLKEVRARRENLFWLGVATFAVIYAIGANTPLFQLFYQLVPGVKSFRAPSMVLFWVPMALLMIAAPIFKTDLSKAITARTVMGFVGFAIAVAISRSMWSSVYGGLGLLVVGAIAVVVNSVWYGYHQNKEFNWFKYAGLNFKRIVQNKDWEVLVLNFPLVILALIILTHQQFTDSGLQAYFGPLKEAVMQSTQNLAWTSVAMIAVFVGGVYLAISQGLKTPGIMGVILIVGLVDTTMQNSRYIQTVDKSQYIQPENPYIAEIKKMSANDPLNDYRVMTFTNRPEFTANSFPIYNMRNAAGFHDNEFASYRVLREAANVPAYIQLAPMRSQLLAGLQSSDPQAQKQAQEYLGMLNESEKTSPAFLDLMNVGYVLMDGQEGVQIIANPRPLPRTWVYHRAQIAERTLVLEVLKSGIQYDKVALIRPEDQASLDPSLLQNSGMMAPDSVRPAPQSKIIEEKSSDEMKISVNTPSAGVVMISSNWHPDWHATIDGAPAKVIPLFGTLQGVPVSAGQHTIEIHYKSSAVEKSKPLVYAGLAMWLGLIGFGLVRRKPKNIA